MRKIAVALSPLTTSPSCLCRPPEAMMWSGGSAASEAVHKEQ